MTVMQSAAYPVAIESHEINGFPVWRFLPQNKGGSAQTDVPHVIALHGLKARKERHLHLYLELVQNGLAVVALDARAHGDRHDSDTSALYNSPNSLPFLLAFSRVIEGTIDDVKAVASYFDVTRYGLWGHSMGGYIATRTALDDKRAEVIVNLSGSVDVTGYGVPNIPPLSNLLRRADIIARAKELSPRPFLLLHGAKDEVVPPAGARRFYETMLKAYTKEGAADRLHYLEYPTLGHDYTPEIRDESVAFFRRYLLEQG